ncbi:hypothetical protein Hdeb2414_s0012g00382171 [Helianthus debilis subsp. tardiflorus]
MPFSPQNCIVGCSCRWSPLLCNYQRCRWSPLLCIASDNPNSFTSNVNIDKIYH